MSGNADAFERAAAVLFAAPGDAADSVFRDDEGEAAVGDVGVVAAGSAVAAVEVVDDS